MANHFAPQWPLGWDLLLVLGIGGAVIVALAAAAGRWAASPAWQAVIWRMATLSLFVLFLFELTGLGQAVAELCRQHVMPGPKISPVNQSADGRQGAGSGEQGAGSGEQGAWSGEQGESGASRPTVEIAATFERASHGTELNDGDGENCATYNFAGTTGPSALDIDVPPGRSWWLAVIWAMGTAIVLAWLVGGRVAVWRFRRKCMPCDHETIAARTAALKSLFGIRRAVSVLTSPRIDAPIVLGGWRPALVLPPRFARDFDAQQQDTILAHELAHLVSRDSAWQAAALVLCALLWWHPLVWWSRRQLRTANETLADEASLVVPDGPRILAEALVLLGQRLMRREPRVGLALGGSRFRSGLGRRVQRLLTLPRHPRPAPCRRRWGFVHFSLPVLMALAAIVGTAGVPFQVPLMQGETTMSVFSNSWRCSLVATALWTMLGTAPAAADDRPATTSTPPAAADREKIEQQLGSIRQKVEQLEKDGKHDEAEKLKHEAREALTKLRGGALAPQAGVSAPEVEKIRGQVKEMSQKADQLERDGKHDEAQRLRSEIRTLYSTIHPRGGANVGPGGPEREQLRQQWLALREKIEKATKEGKQDEVQRLTRETETLRSALYAQASSRPQSGGDREARLQHLRAAAENLKAAGCEPEAQHVMQMVQRMQVEGSGESRSRGDSTRSRPEVRRGDEARGQREPAGDSTRSRPEVRRGDEARGHREPAGDNTRSRPEVRSSSSAPAVTSPREGTARPSTAGATPAVQELQSQVEQMRRELRELREQLNQAKSGRQR